MIKHRDYSRTERDDYDLNVRPYVGPFKEAMPLYTADGLMVAWKIQGRYE